MALRFPPPLRPGDRVGITAPSAGVPPPLRPRLEVALDTLRAAGYAVVIGDCLHGDGVVSAPAPRRAAELMSMLTDPTIAAVVPPFGGELAIDLLPRLDWRALAEAAPTWLVGYSDISTLLLPLATAAGSASLHAPNLMETPAKVPPPLTSWLEVVTAEAGALISQGAATHHGSGERDDWVAEPAATTQRLDTAGTWSLLRPADAAVRTQGRLIGGCLETVSLLAGTRYGDVPELAARHAPEGLIVYLEAAEHPAYDVARDLWRLRLAGWFDTANAVLIGRTAAPGSPGLSQRDAVAAVLGDLGIPVVMDVDVGHVPPQLALVNGALAELIVDDADQRLVQQLG